jgi:hypothetical protein
MAGKQVINLQDQSAELWGPTTKFLTYRENQRLLSTEKIFVVQTPEFLPNGPGVFLKGGLAGANASIELRGGNQPYIDFAENNSSADFRARLIMETLQNMSLQGGNGDPMSLRIPNGFIAATSSRMRSGSAQAVAYGFGEDTRTGLYLSGKSDICVSCEGQEILKLTRESLIANPGNAAAPAYSFATGRMGMFQASPNELAWSIGGIKRMFLRDRLYLSSGLVIGNNAIISDLPGTMCFTMGEKESMRITQHAMLVNKTQSNSANTAFEVQGDTLFNNTWAQLSYSNQTTVCEEASRWYKILANSAMVNGNASYNDSLIIAATGAYKLEYSITYYATTGYITRFGIANTETVIEESITEQYHASVAGPGAPRSISRSFIVIHRNDAPIQYTLQCQVSNGTPQSIVITNATVILHRI